MEFDVASTVTDDGIVVLTISGSMDLTTTSRLRGLLVRLIEAGRHRLVLHLSGVDLIDSIGLGVIVGTVHRLRPHKGSLAIAAPSSPARTVLEISQLVRVVPSYDTADAALGAIREGGAVVWARRQRDQQATAG